MVLSEQSPLLIHNALHPHPQSHLIPPMPDLHQHHHKMPFHIIAVRELKKINKSKFKMSGESVPYAIYTSGDKQTYWYKSFLATLLIFILSVILPLLLKNLLCRSRSLPIRLLLGCTAPHNLIFVSELILFFNLSPLISIYPAWTLPQRSYPGLS